MTALPAPGWEVRPSVEADWPAYRDLRLEMLADTPTAYLETLAEAQLHSDAHWKNRTANASDSRRLFGAVDGDGRWLGTMGCFHPAGAADPVLVGVYVTPAFRGRANGMADALLDAVVDWATGRGTRLLLEVHEHNEPAIRYYLRRGFAFTGNVRPYPLDASTLEREMELALEAPARA